MIIEKPRLTPEERALPLSKYYDIPLHTVGPLFQEILDRGPLDPKDALPVERWTEHLQMPGVYDRPVFGYCLMEGGKSGYISAYSVYPNCTTKMMGWWFNWINIPCKSQPAGRGNIKYKIWGPPGHWTHAFVNGVDRGGGIMVQESLDFLQRQGTPFGQRICTIRYGIDLTEYGVSEQKLRELNEAGIWIDPAVEKFYDLEDYEKGILTPALGTHLMLTMSRPCPTGGMEKWTNEWFGYTAENGKILYDDTIPDYKLTNDWLNMALVHATVEAQQLGKFLPELYEEYHDKPADAD